MGTVEKKRGRCGEFTRRFNLILEPYIIHVPWAGLLKICQTDKQFSSTDTALWRHDARQHNLLQTALSNVLHCTGNFDPHSVGILGARNYSWWNENLEFRLFVDTGYKSSDPLRMGYLLHSTTSLCCYLSPTTCGNKIYRLLWIESK